MSCDAGWWRSKAARSSETKMREGTMHRLWNRIDFAFSSAWQNFWRNAAVSIASVLIVWVVLLALGSLLLVLHSLDQIVALEKTKASAISVYLADTTPLSSAMDFKLHLESDPRVSSVEYVSKDQAMARFRQLPALDPSVIDTLGTNPLPASLDVTVKDIRDLGAIDQEVRTSPLVDKSPATNYEPNVIDKIILLARVAGIAGLVLIIGLTGLSVFIIMLTIRTAIYLRRKEIEVMKLVGATDWFVRWPFIVEGLIVGVVGAVVAVLIVGFGYRPAVVNLQSVLIFVPLAFDPYYLREVLATKQAELAKHIADFGQRMRIMYKSGQVSGLELIFSAANFTDLMNRVFFFNDIVREDRRQLAQLQVVRDQRSSRMQQIAAIEAQFQRQLAEMQAQRAALQAQIASLIRESFRARSSGKWKWPLDGVITQGFGCTTYPFEPYDPSCPSQHFHSGIDI